MGVVRGARRLLGGRRRQRRGRRGRSRDLVALIPEGGIELEQELLGLERRYLIEALKMTGGHMTKAAKLLGMSYRSIRYRVKKLGIKEKVEA